MAATLPSRNLDTETGRNRVAVYVRLLSDYTEAAMAHLSRTACATLEWFPTPAQCIRILDAFTDRPTPRDTALSLCHSFAQSQFEAFRAALKAGEATPDLIASVPDQWRRIAVEQGFLRKIGETYELEPRWRTA
jgi:hypothetical protein